jgi:hypothetical protein
LWYCTALKTSSVGSSSNICTPAIAVRQEGNTDLS